MHPCEGVRQQLKHETEELCGPRSLINEPRAAEHIALLLLLKRFHRHTHSLQVYALSNFHCRLKAALNLVPVGLKWTGLQFC